MQLGRIRVQVQRFVDFVFTTFCITPFFQTAAPTQPAKTETKKAPEAKQKQEQKKKVVEEKQTDGKKKETKFVISIKNTHT
jgi:hypothetical protein